MLLEKSGRRREAAARYRNVLTGGPEARLRRLAEARALMMEGQDDEAERKLRRAVAIEPNDAAALALLGSLLQDAGSFVEAASCFERALAQRGTAQDLAHLYYDLVRCRKVTAQDAVIIQSLRSAVAQRGRAGETGIKLNLALGKALDDLGQYGEAMQRFDAAADIRARVWPVDVAAFERRVGNIIDRFSAEFIESKRFIGSPDPAPVLIFGMPRSGTTLCEQIVSSHPMAYGADELPYWIEQGLLMESAAFNVDDQFIVRGAAGCLSLLRQMAGDATRIVDKNPFNFQ
jgi:tetratricopeptide (TPR) repeat protein